MSWKKKKKASRWRRKGGLLEGAGIGLYLLHSNSKALLDLKNHSDTKRSPLEVFLTTSTTWARTKKYTVLPFPLHTKLLFHLLPFLTQIFSWVETDSSAANRERQFCWTGKEREKERWPGHAVNWGSEPGTRVIAVVVWPASPKHPSVTDHLRLILQAQSTLFSSDLLFFHSLFPLCLPMTIHKQGMQHLRSNSGILFDDAVCPGGNIYPPACRAAQDYFIES